MDEPKEDPESELELKLRDIEERAAKTRSHTDLPEVPEWDYKRKSKPPGEEIKADQGSYRGIGVGFSIAYGFVGPVLAGYGIGWLIDHKSGAGTTWQTWLTLAGMFVGFVWVILLVNKIGNR